MVNYSYLENSSLISGYTGPNGFEVTRDFEPNRNLLTEVKNQFDNATISQYNYTNDELGRRTQRIDTMINSTTNTFGYNSKSELIDAAMGLDDYGYDYDQIGNRITAFSTEDSVTSEMDYLSNALNQYTNIYPLPLGEGQGEGLCYYDSDGNMLTNNGWTYTWNGENRLIRAQQGQFLIVDFSYDYMGRRFQKIKHDGASITTNTFIYDGWNPIAEFSTGDSQVDPSTNYYTWGLDLSGSLQGAGGIGGLLSTVQDGDIYFSCFDANGNVTEYVDETGDIVAHYEYNPFGGITSATGDKKDDFNFRFSTKYLDSETALYYYGLRYYIPLLGRFINKDPIEEEGGLNLYGYVSNDPVASYDAFGLRACTLEPTDEIKYGSAEWQLWLRLGKITRRTGGGFKGDQVKVTSPGRPRRCFFWMKRRVELTMSECSGAILKIIGRRRSGRSLEFSHEHEMRHWQYYKEHFREVEEAVDSVNGSCVCPDCHSATMNWIRTVANAAKYREQRNDAANDCLDYPAGRRSAKCLKIGIWYGKHVDAMRVRDAAKAKMESVCR